MTTPTPSRCARGANGRLTSATWGTLAYGFAYNGLGDRVRQTVAGTPTNYSLDLSGGLTQVLTDGTTAYLYGNSRIGEEQPGGWQYHLGDALGSVRQSVDASVSVTLSRAYEPFGDSLSTSGTVTSMYAFAGEQRDATGLVYLRARYYGPAQGRFLSRDTWEGDPSQPMSYNAWLYVYSNPINTRDPAGRCPDDDMDGRCDQWWLRCRTISDPELYEQCACDTPTPRPARLSPSESCERFVAAWESCVLRPYSDNPEDPASGYCTVGLGRMLHPGPCTAEEVSSPITEQVAWAMLRSDVWEAASGVRTYVQVPLVQHQFDALVSLTYSTGVEQFRDSRILRTLNEGDYASVYEIWLTAFTTSHGVPRRGLERRRPMEAAMFANGDYPELPVPVCQ